MKIWPLCALLLVVFSGNSLGRDSSPPKAAKISPQPQKSSGIKNPAKKQFLFNLGSHTEFFNNVQIGSSGELRQFDFAPTVGAGLMLPLKSEFLFLPEINWVLPQTVDGTKIIRNLFMFRADLGHQVVDWLRLRVGTSVMWLNQHGRGGSTQINNGNSSSTFYYPDQNVSSFNNTLDVGAEVLHGQWSIRLQTYIYSVFLEDRRQISYTLMGSYYWDR